MLFNSIDFVVFFVVVFALYSALPHLWQKVLLLASSYFFYGCWDWRFLSLLVLSTVVDFYCAQGIKQSSDEQKRKALLIVSLSVNLGLLFFFKYFNFFIDGALDLLLLAGIEGQRRTLNIILPVGISFYTFQTLSYTLDVYNRKLEPTKRVLEFAVYVSFFPQLVAGPIERASNLLPQFQAKRAITQSNLMSGLWLIALGFLKKLVIADRCAMVVNQAMNDATMPYDGLENWLYLYAFAFQIYGDFSGYTDIARGIARMMSYDLMLNFRKPYLVCSPSEFWRNWHISLSTWLRDYLYIGLGGNRGGTFFTYRNLMITMVLGGIWHGAGWAYLFWGLYQGLLLVVHRLLAPLLGRIAPESSSRFWRWIWKAVSWFVFFHLVCIGWLFFRAGSLPAEISQIDFLRHGLGSLFTAPTGILDMYPVRAILLTGALTFGVQAFYREIEEYANWSVPSQALAITFVLLCITMFGVFQGSEFIYFQF